MDKDQAIADIVSIFSGYDSLWSSATSELESKKPGKLYELYVLTELLRDLRGRGFTIRFVGSSIKFKASPGQIKLSDPHFHLVAPSGREFWIFVDIEFRTLGSDGHAAVDFSHLHELDIVVVDDTPPYPSFDNIALAVECKCVGNFEKQLIKEALGVRRELSLLPRFEQESILSRESAAPPVNVRAHPASEFWLAFTDPKGTQYAMSPATFGIELRHIEP
jgi:hypothetical protein